MTYECPKCLDQGHVCENHPDRPWADWVGPDEPGACDCGGAGMPCACCQPISEDGQHDIREGFLSAAARRRFAQQGG